MNATDQIRGHRIREVHIDRPARIMPARTDARDRSRSVTLTVTAREFARQPSPRIVAGLLVAAAAARITVGDWRLVDAAVPAVMITAFPFAEWVIHVCVLHWRPRRIGRVTVDSLLAREHRRHHAHPRDVGLVFIPWQTYLWLLPAALLVALVAFPSLGSGLTFLITVGVLGLNYEWTHYLIHTDYQPRSRTLRALRRNHRLHHFKNERYWFTVTTSGTADRLLRTHPDPAAIPNSQTAKALPGTPDQ